MTSNSNLVKPDYQGGGIVNLMSSLTLGLSGRAGLYPPLRLLPPPLVANAAHVVLLVLDGLGYRYVERHSGIFSPYLKGPITSVFPSSTAPAVTTFLTGVAPQQHAVTGWFMHLKELGTIGVILPFRPRWNGITFTKSGIGVGQLIGAGSMFDSLDAYGYFVIHDSLLNSPYSEAGAGSAGRVGYRTLQEYFAVIAGLVRRATERSYVYAYWNLFDTLAHKHGVGSAVVKTHFGELEQGFRALLDSLSGTDTLVIATADHGFIDTAPAFTVNLSRHPELADCLALPLCGEPRAAYCHVRPGRVSRFERYVGERLAEGFELYPSEALLREGWFGLGEPDPRLAERIGDYTLLPRDRYTIKDTLPMEKPWADIGVHGGVSADEMYVPLIVAHV